MVIAPEHPQVASLTTEEHRAKVEAYLKDAAKKSDLERTELQKEKSGVFTGDLQLSKDGRRRSAKQPSIC